MRATTLLACSLASIGLSVAEVKEAPMAHGGPAGVVYKATLLDKSSTTVRGYISGTVGKEGHGVDFKLDFSGFPDEEEFGPFSYHIHDQPVSEDGNCTVTLAHLDPFVRGETPPCDPEEPATCQIGDLSGKFGAIKDVADGKHFVQSYHDMYVTTLEGPAAFFGNRSVVVHSNDKTRINCANFELVKSNTTTVLPTGGAKHPTGTGDHAHPTATPTTTSPPFDGGAIRAGAFSGAAVLAGLAAFFL
ncbi:hypothetical protein AJ80_09877 [Polytolypa hystricis UAMH7299]|uniref:superoxide dismutase n=1 Tax=Polytolypa hystricis (strain UAMH7299) TaxID=1447883 RepID=A0A2B7WH55_POLH7|nr:hypothetical protein AJ80_09877 [Polytolypa hystricis UAMH7299]